MVLFSNWHIGAEIKKLMSDHFPLNMINFLGTVNHNSRISAMWSAVPSAPSVIVLCLMLMGQRPGGADDFWNFESLCGASESLYDSTKSL